MAPTVWHVIVPGGLLGGCSRHYQSWHFSDWRRCGVEGSGQKVVWEAEAPGNRWILAECHKVSEEGA